EPANLPDPNRVSVSLDICLKCPSHLHCHFNQQTSTLSKKALLSDILTDIFPWYHPPSRHRHPFAINTLEYGAIKEEDHSARRPRKKDGDPNTPKPVSFKVKETVCPKTTQRPLEQCDFKDNGLVKQCEGTVILDRNRGYFDINCDEILQVRKLGQLGELIQQGGQKIVEKIQKIGQRIRDFFSNLRPRQEA
uniref:Cathelicidin antimicrobial peptide C-terminal domain-containing protein n=1 Tax=Felis catus TaxID=9685 RepID=A0ABI8AQJ8_FELCA